MDHALPFSSVSGWLPQGPGECCPALAQDVQADVVIIGGGCTGLSTALALRGRGADVAVLEAEFVGAGASGRNAGYVAGPAVMDLPLVRLANGRAGTEKLVRFAATAVEHMEHLMVEHGVDCDYRPSGVVLAAVHPRQERRIQQWRALYESFGGTLQYQTREQLAERGVPAAFRCGLFDHMGGVFDPGKYMLGLRRAALRAGVRVYEDSPVCAIEPGAKVRARTERGSVTADHAVLATNAYARALRSKRTILPLRVCMFETAPLEDRHVDALGWPGFEGINTMHEVIESFRRTERGTIAGGSKVFAHAWGGTLPPADAQADFRALQQAFYDRFPMLRDVPITRYWSGYIAHTTDFRPVMGIEGAHRNVLFGMGYCGHGMAQATLMGSVLAERIMGREHPLEDHVHRRVFSWPPEPLTSAIVKTLQVTMRRTDDRVDNSLRQETRPAVPGK